MKTDNESSQVRNRPKPGRPTNGGTWLAGIILFFITATVICLSTLFHPAPALAQTRVYLLSTVTNATQNDYFIIDVADSSSATGFKTKKIKIPDALASLGTNGYTIITTNVNWATNYVVVGTNVLIDELVSNYFYTNVWLDTYVSNWFQTNQYWTNAYQTNITVTNFYEGDTYVSNTFETNVYVTDNWYVSNYFTTNQYLTFNDISSNYNTYTTNVWVTENWITTNIYVTNLNVRTLIMQGLNLTTNIWNGPTNDLDMRFLRVFYDTAVPCAVTNIRNWDAGGTEDTDTLLTLHNKAATNVQVFLTGKFKTHDGAGSYWLTNGETIVLSIRYTPVFGGLTQAVTRTFYRAP